jgi:hypothetical protein
MKSSGLSFSIGDNRVTHPEGVIALIAPYLIRPKQWLS